MLTEDKPNKVDASRAGSGVDLGKTNESNEAPIPTSSHLRRWLI